MSLYLESIKLLDGRFYRLNLHQNRMDFVHDQFFSGAPRINLDEILMSQDFPMNGMYKCRILYDSTVQSIDLQEYTVKQINSLQLVHADIASQKYKSTDRDELNRAYEQRNGCDDVLICVDGYVKDSWYCNVALFNGVDWVTPRNPIIYGVNRSELIKETKIVEGDIAVDSLSGFTKIRLFNAMIEFGALEISIDQIRK